MQKNEKSKKKISGKLHLILDNPSRGNLTPENEKYLQSLRKRLKRSSEESMVYVQRGFEEFGKEETDSLKPQVKIYQKEEIKKFVLPEIKHEEPVEEEQKEKEKEEKIESLYEGEELYEVEKVEVEGPEFLEVKPKETIEKEEIPESLEREITEESKELESVRGEELPEWEPVDTKDKETEDTKVEEIKEEKPESKEELPFPIEEKEEPRESETIVIEKKKEEEFIPEKKEEDRESETIAIEKKKEEEFLPKEKEEILEFEEDIESKIDVFKDINSIDEKTAKLLFENDITSLDILKETPIKKLTKIKGIKRKLAKKIKKEVDEIAKKTDESIAFQTVDKDISEGELSKQDLEDSLFVEQKGEDVEEWDSYYEEDIPESKLKEVKGYRHGDYTLYKKEIEIEAGKKRTVHFFSKAEPDEGEPVELPAGFEVKLNKKTGVPYLKKKK